MPDDFLSGASDPDNPVYQGAMAVRLRDDQIIRVIGEYKAALDRGEITQEQFDAVQGDLMKKAAGESPGAGE